MIRINPGVAIVGLGLLCGGCAGGQPAPESGAQPAATQTVTYKCASCGKTVTAAADAPAPSC